MYPATLPQEKQLSKGLNGQASPSRLSDVWLSVIREAVNRGQGTVSIDSVLHASAAVGNPVGRGNARSQMASRTDLGDFVRVNKGVFQITEKGRATFGLPLDEKQAASQQIP
jgi:hypothetical protein